MNKPMTDKTQEELEKFLDTVKIHNKDLDVCINDAVAKKWLTHYINKYYVPREEVEKIIGEDEKLNKAHETNDCPGCNTFDRNQLRAEQREKLKSIRRDKR